MLVLEKIDREGYSSAEGNLQKKNGERALYYFTAVKTIVDGKKYFTGIGIDITERKKAEEALRLSELKFSNIFNISPDVVGITRAFDGKMVAGNPALTKIIGFTPEEYLGRTTLEMKLWPAPSDREEMIRLLQKNGEINDLEINLRTKDGSFITCLFSAKPLTYNNEACLIFVVHDITQQKKSRTRDI